MQRCIDIAVLAAIPLEVAGLTAGLALADDGIVGGQQFAIGTLRGQSILVGTLGFGKVNAAATVAALAERFRLGQVWHVGCAGAYSGGHLNIGDVLITTEFHCGDEGVLASGEESPQSSIGIPLVTVTGAPYFDSFPVDQHLLDWARTTAPPSRYRNRAWEDGAGKGLDILQVEAIELRDDADDTVSSADLFRVSYGPSLTVSLASGDAAVAQERFLRYQALAENMEGSAVAQAGLRFAIPVLECRGISNLAGDRDKSHWRLELAVAHSQAVVRRLLSSWIDSPRSWAERHFPKEAMD
jgi:futalosine hydrolase